MASSSRVECPPVSSATFIAVLSHSNAVAPLPSDFVPTLPNRPQSAPLPTFSYLKNDNSAAPFQMISSQLPPFLHVSKLATQSPYNIQASSLSL